MAMFRRHTWKIAEDLLPARNRDKERHSSLDTDRDKERDGTLGAHRQTPVSRSRLPSSPGQGAIPDPNPVAFAASQNRAVRKHVLIEIAHGGHILHEWQVGDIVRYVQSLQPETRAVSSWRAHAQSPSQSGGGRKGTGRGAVSVSTSYFAQAGSGRLTYRDIRQVCSDGNQQPSIEVRRHCIVLCLQPVTALIFFDRVLILVHEELGLDELITQLAPLTIYADARRISLENSVLTQPGDLGTSPPQLFRAKSTRERQASGLPPVSPPFILNPQKNPAAPGRSPKQTTQTGASTILEHAGRSASKKPEEAFGDTGVGVSEEVEEVAGAQGVAPPEAGALSRPSPSPEMFRPSRLRTTTPASSPSVAGALLHPLTDPRRPSALTLTAAGGQQVHLDMEALKETLPDDVFAGTMLVQHEHEAQQQQEEEERERDGESVPPSPLSDFAPLPSAFMAIVGDGSGHGGENGWAAVDGVGVSREGGEGGTSPPVCSRSEPDLGRQSEQEEVGEEEGCGLEALGKAAGKEEGMGDEEKVNGRRTPTGDSDRRPNTKRRLSLPDTRGVSRPSHSMVFGGRGLHGLKESVKRRLGLKGTEKGKERDIERASVKWKKGGKGKGESPPSAYPGGGKGKGRASPHTLTQRVSDRKRTSVAASRPAAVGPPPGLFFEFAALECLMSAAFKATRMAVEPLEAKATGVARKLKSRSPSTVDLENLHMLKFELAGIVSRVAGYDKAIDELLLDPESLSNMELTKRYGEALAERAHQEQLEALGETEIREEGVRNGAEREREVLKRAEEEKEGGLRSGFGLGREGERWRKKDRVRSPQVLGVPPVSSMQIMQRDSSVSLSKEGVRERSNRRESTMQQAMQQQGLQVPFQQPDPDLEILLEFFDQEVDELKERLRRIEQSIVHTEQLITLKLAVVRNRVVTADLVMSIVMTGLSAGAVASGIFGMNLENAYEESHSAFTTVSGLILFIFLASVLLGAYIARRINL
uniref:Magnesium transporter n=1 Tax=Chromera velia CCMP2878 TaxID=1169474 RepID=A0A0K6S9Y8_9ALVE|eukprot:Cvel_31348.t1-p1 / transcript=Cvel_31348.t1 / gene=Cvel_31348 / organism=Chromera_velia_CCMP2878 / gene_product=Magnesium transporter MRS2-3, putative / transcript_product=Magnesium transporter MRS2-3, putative / location=Cvel_scaffold4657:2135-6833(-) / protein_length=985 / sequence_SO=supercontig / SO=protein_coding / is_pseudo=false